MVGSSGLASTHGVYRELFEVPAILRFDDNSLDALWDTLRELDDHTQLIQAGSPSELQLQDSGITVRDGWRLSAHCFRQISGILFRGASALLPQLSGQIKDTSDCEFMIDGPLAIDIWNRLVELRFRKLLPYRLIVNTSAGRIEGVAGRSRVFLGNAAFLTHMLQASERVESPSRYLAAKLSGRVLTLWFREPTPAFECTLDHAPFQFYHGQYAVNGEATGTAVRASPAVFTTRGFCLPAAKSGGVRIAHAGMNFQTRVETGLASIFRTRVLVNLANAAAELERSLGFNSTMRKNQCTVRTQRLGQVLGILGVPDRIIKITVDRIATADNPLATLGETEAQRMSRRTVYDVFVELLRMARNASSGQQEALGRAAFSVMEGRLLSELSTIEATASYKERNHGATGFSDEDGPRDGHGHCE